MIAHAPNCRRGPRSPAHGRRSGRRRPTVAASRPSSEATSGSPPRLALVATSARSDGASRQRRKSGCPRARAGRASGAACRRASGRRRARPGATLGRAARGFAQARSAGRDGKAARARPAPSLRESLGAREIRDHHGEGLGVARLAAAQVRDRGLVARVAQEMEAAEALQRDNSAARIAAAASATGGLSCGPQRGQAIGSA